MTAIKSLIQLCITILQININLFGFNISLFAVLVWGLALIIVTWLLFGLFK